MSAILIGVFCSSPSHAQPADAPAVDAPTPPDKPPLKPEELEQLLAPIALYPDSLLTQVLMASTYPLEVVQADRWMQANKDLTGDALATELEKQDWDPSVKSIVNFPDVLSLMSQKLDITIKIGDAFIEQQADVMNTVQSLRGKAQQAGNLASNEQQKIVVEAAPAPEPQTIVVQQVAPPPQIIRIESPSPTVIYVPTYNPVVVYGAWPYPAYPPYPYYPPRPPHYVASAGIWFGVGVACGSAWGYAWGKPNWAHYNVKVNVNQNVNFNSNINRSKYNSQINNNINIQGGNRTNIQGGNKTNIQGGNRTNVQGGGDTNWKHDPSHRKGVAYRDQATSQEFRGANQSEQAAKAREQYRGRDTSADALKGKSAADLPKNKPAADRPKPTADASGAAQRDRPSGNAPKSGDASRGNVFDGSGGNGNSARSASERGRSSLGSGGRSSSAGSGKSRSGGGAPRNGKGATR